MKRLHNLGYCGLCAILLGCGAGPTDDGEEVLGEAVLAVGEQSCAEDAVADDDIYDSYCSDDSSISPDGSYGSTDCPGQYVVEFDGFVSNITGFGYGWGDTLPSTQALCEKAHSYVTAWQLLNGVWDPLGSSHVTGTWSGGACSFANPAGFDPVDVNADLVRVAARAVQCPTSGLCFIPTVKKARAYVWGTVC